MLCFQNQNRSFVSSLTPPELTSQHPESGKPSLYHLTASQCSARPLAVLRTAAPTAQPPLYAPPRMRQRAASTEALRKAQTRASSRVPGLGSRRVKGSELAAVCTRLQTRRLRGVEAGAGASRRKLRGFGNRTAPQSQKYRHGKLKGRPCAE